MSEPAAVEHERLLVEGLVGPHRYLYHHSASFRAAVKTLARMLPLMVDGLAADAERQDQRHREMMAALMAPQTPVNLDLILGGGRERCPEPG